MSDAFWDAQAGVKWNDLNARLSKADEIEAAARIKAQAIPEKPDKYEFKLPGDFKAPDGIDINLDDKNPLVGAWRETAHKLGLGQDGFEAGVGLYAKHQAETAAADQAALAQAKANHIKALGTNGEQRLSDLNTFLDQKFGEGVSKHFELALFSKQGVEIMERLIAGQVGSGAGSFSQTGRADQGATNDALLRQMYPSMKN